MAKIALVTFYDDIALGTRIISSYLKKHGHKVKLIFVKIHSKERVEKPQKNPIQYQKIENGLLYSCGADINPLTSHELNLALHEIISFSPDIFGVGTRSLFDDLAIEFARLVEKVLPKTLKIAGGFGPTLAYEKYLQSFDIVVRGDGEETCLELANALHSGNSYKEVNNIVFKTSKGIQCNSLRTPEKDLSKYPYPDHFDSNIVLIEKNKTIFGDPWGPSRLYPIIVGRGCLNKCSYCSGGNWRTIYTDEGVNMPSRRIRDINDVMAELIAAKKSGFEKISFRDEFFLFKISDMKKLFNLYQKRISLNFFAHIHPIIPQKHPDLFQLMLDSGLSMTTIGIQSGCEEFANNIYKRKNSNEHIVNHAHIMSHYDVNLQYHFIGGNPLETNKNFENTLQLAKQLPFDLKKNRLDWFYFTPFPRSPIVKEYGMEKLIDRNHGSWLRQGYMLFLRTQLNDSLFNYIRNNASLDELSILCKDISQLSHKKWTGGVIAN